MAVSIADQGVASVSHLLLHVFLARLWEPSGYGLFAIVFALLLFLTGVHAALVAEPMSVLGPARHGSALRGYLTSTLWLQGYVALAGAVTAGLAGALAAPWSMAMAAALGGLVLAGPGFLTFMLLRRACYVLDRPHTALFSSIVYGTGILLGMLLLHRVDRLSPLAVLILMGLAGGAAALLASWRLELAEGGRGPSVGRLWKENWDYGRWILAAHMAHWGGIGVYVFFVGALAGLAEAGAFRALQTLMGPAQQGLTALGLLMLPWLAGRRVGPGAAETGLRELARLWGPVVAMIAGYGLVLSIWAEPVTDLVYGRAEYTAAARLLPVFALFILGTAVAHGLTLSLRSAERTEPVFWSKAAASGVALLLGLAMTWRWGLAGAAWGMTMSVFAEAAVLIFACTARRRV